MSDRDDWGPDCPTSPCEGPNCPCCGDQAPDVREILDRMRQRCAECHRPGSSHKLDCATGRAEDLAKLREMRAAGLLPGYVPALGDPAPEAPCLGSACAGCAVCCPAPEPPCPGPGDISHLGCPACRCRGCGDWVPEHTGGSCLGYGF